MVHHTVVDDTPSMPDLPTNGTSLYNSLNCDEMNGHAAMPKDSGSRAPIAIVGMALRLPGHCITPKDLWDFMKRGGVATTKPPQNRFNLSGHYDGSRKPYTMKTPGAMFLEDVDPADFDAQFFNINHMDASSMDPQQRIMMEVAYECLENAGISLESLSGQRVGCLVGASAVDYHDLTCRDPEDRTESPTMGSGRALLSNRLSHFLNVHGPSMTLDTACSSSLVALDAACLYLQADQCDAVLVGGVNLYLSPERNQDMGAMRPTASATGRCHTFDAKADGYVAAEAVNAIFIKRLDDAVRNGDPIHAIIRGTATNSAGRTPGIALPDAGAQAAAIRAAYMNSGIAEAELAETGYLECHGTGTLVGDPIEVDGVAAVFSPHRAHDRPLVIGSVKSNIGHSEAAAGLSGLIKSVLAIRHSCIPGTATFLTPNPQIDFERCGLRASRTAIPWPSNSKKRASVNSFGFGGANAHAVIETPEYLLGNRAPSFKSTFGDSQTLLDNWFENEDQGDDHLLDVTEQPKLIVLSANSQSSLEASAKTLAAHLLNPAVTVDLQDLAYTLSERRSRLFHRAFSIQTNTHISASSFEFGKSIGEKEEMRVGFVFTGQGAQWPQMGKQLLYTFPRAREIVEDLDKVLQGLPKPPAWSLVCELTEERSADHMRQPEFSQPLVTALQIAMVAVLRSWGIRPSRVVGHSSGEIAAAVTAGLMSEADAIKIAYFRGQAGKTSEKPRPAVGMLAVGIGASLIEKYIDPDDDLVQIACFNSPRSLTMSGTVAALERLHVRLKTDNHFARMLVVDHAYHSNYMTAIGKRYMQMLAKNCEKEQLLPSCGDAGVVMFSSVTGQPMIQQTNASYWLENMVSQVRFDQAAGLMVKGEHGARFLVEIGPSDALRGPLSQIIDTILVDGHSRPVYSAATKRGQNTCFSMYGVAGKLFTAGGSPNFTVINGYGRHNPPSVLVDLPNYVWSHTKKYWHESQASKDWRFRPFLKHDLLGTKILGTSWQSPLVWRNTLRLRDNSWLRDHMLGEQVVFPGAGYVSMAMEAIYQRTIMGDWTKRVDGVPDKYRYKLRDVKFLRALVLEDDKLPKVLTSLTAASDTTNNWYTFKVSSILDEIEQDHACGLIRIETDFQDMRATDDILKPLQLPISSSIWYKAMAEAGFHFGPSFQKLVAMEYAEGQRVGRSVVSLETPVSAWAQSPYVMHPACIDGCFQTIVAPAWAGDHSAINAALVPRQIDSLTIPWCANQPSEAIAVACSEYVGVGRTDAAKSYTASTAAYNPANGDLLLEMKGLRYAELDYAHGEEKVSAHTYMRVHWEPDITLISQAGFQQIIETNDIDIVSQRFMDLVAHKYPGLRVLEVDLNSDTQHSYPKSLWLQSNGSATRSSCSKHVLVSNDARSLAAAQNMYPEVSRPDIRVVDFAAPDSVALGEKEFDLTVLNLPAEALTGVEYLLGRVLEALTDQGYALLIFDEQPLLTTELRLTAREAGFNQAWTLGSLALVLARCAPEPSPRMTAQLGCVIYRLQFSEVSEGSCKVSTAVENALCQSGMWHVVRISDPSQLAPQSMILILDELDGAIMTELDARQWKIIQQLIKHQCDILWVTTGAQMRVTNPTGAAIHGFLRVLRNEEPLLRLTTLDVGSASASKATMSAIHTTLGAIRRTDSNASTERFPIDYEFVERDGLVHISRVLPDTGLNTAAYEARSGRPAKEMDIHAARGCIRLRAEKIGSIEELVWGEVSVEPIPLAANRVEVEVFAAGVNFKEVAVTLGIVPENEHLLGGEGAGIVTRVAPDVAGFAPGQRVVFFEKGSFGNRVIMTSQRVRRISDAMTFEEAATVPAVFMTSMYALHRLAQVKRGHRVLIHSAAGGVGLSAIQLCQHVGAEIYATVGTQEKRDLLVSQYGIPDKHIFSSRTSAFSQQILELTGGNGVDIILNSLTGDLLEESWRIIADGGTMVEIGKKDILDHHNLPMEPFSRNASFRAFDLSHSEISDDLIASLLDEIFILIEGGHLKPINPLKVFPFREIPAALRLLRSGKNMGKLIISDGPGAQIHLPVRPKARCMRLRPNACYLVIGGLRGLCSSLVIYLAKQGAKHIAVMSRSRCYDDHVQRVVQNVRALGCSIHLSQGDVCRLEDVRAVFEATPAPVVGIVQGAMVLRDRTFESMSVDEYHAALGCKITGTWNLHQVAQERRLVLDFFTLLSSISGLCGSKGQANYAAGNTFLDAFATYRLQQGLAACSVDLGIIQDVGYMAGKEYLQKRYDRTVWHPINERLLRDIFAFSVMQQQAPAPPKSDSQAHIVTGIVLPQPQQSTLVCDARFGGLYRRGGDGGPLGKKLDGSKDVQAILLMLRSKTEIATVLAAAVEVSNRFLMTSLRMSEALDATRPLATYGIDSLAAVEFRNWLRMEFSVELSTLEIVNAPSLTSICGKVLAKIPIV